MTEESLKETVQAIFHGLFMDGQFEGSYYCAVNETEVSGAVGERNDHEACNDDTVFFIGSIEKTLAGIVALFAEEEEVINRNDKIGDYLPIKAPARIDDLYHHKTGIWDVVCDDSLTDRHLSLEDLIDIVNEKSAKEYVEDTFRYATTNYVLLWSILQEAYRRTPIELIRDKIGSKSSIASIGHGMEILEEKNYSESEDLKDLLKYSANTQTIPGADLMYMSCKELGRLIHALENGKVLNGKALARMNDKSIKVEDGLYYGIGMFVSDKGWIGHGGTAGEYRSAITHEFRHNITIARCSRKQNSPYIEPLSEKILCQILSKL